MEPSGFDDQIFGEFSGPLSPMGAKVIHQHPGNSGHSIQVMLGMPHTSENNCPSQRLPDVHNLLPGSPKIDHYKNMDYGKPIEYQPNGKIECYTTDESGKIEYINGKYSPVGTKVIEYVNGSGDYSPGRIEYEKITVFHQPQSMNSPGGRKSEKIESSGSSTPITTSSNSSGGTDASSTTNGNKKNDKSKKADNSGVKKKKTR